MTRGTARQVWRDPVQSLGGARLDHDAVGTTGLSATVAGILLVGYAGVHPSVGQGYEFAAITAVVLGGGLLGGGRGAIALELLFTFLTARGIESTWRPTVQGVIIIVAVAIAGRAWLAGRRPSRRSGRHTERSTATPNPPTPGTTTGDS